MSIFKDTIKPYVRAQLRARQQIISSEDPNVRNNQLVGYLSKNSWVKMTSLVDYDSYDEINIEDTDRIKIKPDGRYVTQDLSKKYQLFGGTLYNDFSKQNYLSKDKNLSTSLRYGFNGKGAIYQSDLNRVGVFDQESDKDKAIRPLSKLFNFPLGARPMPGIKDVQITNKSAYGSLREATVKFYCWDKHQLEELEILFMRPGYSVLLEWGWSKYIDYDNSVTGSLSTIKSDFNVLKEINRVSSDKLNIKTFPTLYTINPFDYTLTQDIILAETDKKSKEHKANYDSMLGYVKNFTWTLLDDGGYECTTILISIGEVISSLKVSSNGAIGESMFLDPDAPKKYQYTDYEKLLLSFKALTQKLRNDQGRIPNYLRDDIDFTISGSYSDVDLDQLEPSKILTQVKERFKKRDEQRAKIQKAQGVADDDIENKLTDLYNLYITDDDNRGISTPLIKLITSADGQQYKNNRYEYIPLDLWVCIMDAYFTLKSSIDDIYIYFDIPYKTPCLAARDSISIDPSICYVENPEAFPELLYMDFNYKLKGYKGVNPLLLDRTGLTRTNLYDFYQIKKHFGYLDNIVINIDYLLSTFKNMNSSTNNDGVDVLSYVQNVLNGISNALGGLNNFKIFVNENKLTIGDSYYLEDPDQAKINTKFEFDLMGLGSICRDVKITSRIFQEQSTMIAIGAQNKGNVGDIYTSTQTLFNAGLTDRLARTKSMTTSQNPDETNATTAQYITDDNNHLYNKLLLLVTYIKDYITGKEIGNSNAFEISIAKNTPAASSTLRSILLQFNPEINYKALIPFELEITLDGIGGLVIGQIFKINKNILPKDYYNKNLGFIITGISHDLSKNDWTTTIKTQICLLDNIEGYTNSQTKLLNDALVAARKKKVAELVQKYNIQCLNYGILQDYILYLANRSVTSYMFASLTDSQAKKYFDKEPSLIGLEGSDLSNWVILGGSRSTSFPFPKLSNAVSPRYFAFLNFVKAVRENEPLEFYNINAGDFVQKPSTPYQYRNDGGVVNWYPAKQFKDYDDWHGYDTFALDWIQSLKNYLEANSTDNSGNNIGDKPIAVGSNTTFSQMLDKYIEEINYHRNYGSTTIKIDPANPKPFECFRPDLYLIDGKAGEGGDQSIKEDLATGTGLTDNIGISTILTPDGYNNVHIFTSDVFQKFRTENNNYDFYNINYDKLYKNIQGYLNDKVINNFSLRILYSLYTSGEITTNFGKQYVTNRNNSDSPVYKDNDIQPKIVAQSYTFGEGNLGEPEYDIVSLDYSKNTFPIYQITNLSGTTGASKRSQLTKHKN